jgi:2-iminobutanoate/2-iminopropanoate deaminase
MRKQITAEKGATPQGPYSHAIVARGTFVYVSGQGPLDPATGKLLEDFREAAIQTLKNVQTILEAAGAGMGDVVKVNAYLRSMDDFSAFNEIYKTFFSEPFPARTTVQSTMRIPIEVDVVAVLPE